MLPEVRDNIARSPQQHDRLMAGGWHPELARVKRSADIALAPLLTDEERIGRVGVVRRSERPHDMVAMATGRAPLLIQLAHESAANSVGVGPLAVDAPHHARSNW